MTQVRVLVVDDQEPFRQAAVAVIEATPGFTVTAVVQSGEDSIAAAVATPVDLVLMDLNLPGMDGIAAAARLRELAHPPAVLLLSTYDQDDVAERVADLGTAVYLAKSRFGPERLAAVWARLAGAGAGPRCPANG